MARPLAPLLAALALCSCGGDVTWENHGYGWYFNAETPAGWRVRWSDVVDESRTGYLSDPAFYDLTWQRMKDCTGLDAQPAFIVMKPLSYIQARYGQDVGGRYESNPPLIVSEETGQLLRHEMGHHLLQSATGNLDPSHHHPMFHTDGCTFSVPWQ